MNPSVDITKVDERYFNYSIRLGSGGECRARQGLHSFAECLHDTLLLADLMSERLKLVCLGAGFSK